MALRMHFVCSRLPREALTNVRRWQAQDLDEISAGHLRRKEGGDKGVFTKEEEEEIKEALGDLHEKIGSISLMDVLTTSASYLHRNPFGIPKNYSAHRRQRALKA